MKAWFRRWSSVFETAMFRRKNRVIRFLKDKLQEAVYYGNYHKRIGKLIKKTLLPVLLPVYCRSGMIIFIKFFVKLGTVIKS